MTAALLLATAAVAGAANKAETFSLTPFVGGYTFDGVQHLDPAPLVGMRAGYNFTERFGSEAVFDYAGTRVHNDVNVYNYHLDLLYHFFPSAKAVPFLMAGYGGMTIEKVKANSYTKGAFNYGLGLKYALTDSLELRGEVRHLLHKAKATAAETKSETLSNVEYGIGLGFLFGGVKPAPAPVVAPPPPAPAPVVAPPKPAPAPPAASLSVAPTKIEKGSAATLNWACQNSTGADIRPEIGPVPVQGSRSVTPADSLAYTLTCTGPGGEATSTANLAVTLPAPVIGDADKDGVLDNLDQCPDTPAGVKVDARGCPLDGDKDGVPDYLDKCPETPAGMPVDKEGCSPETLTITLDVEFDTAKADIKKKYHVEIGRVADFLNKYTTVTGNIEGHTDNVGSTEMNKKLSQRRADSVLKYLVEKYGVDKNRLTATGYGAERPIADNANAAGRQKNRRTVAKFETVVKK